jgi:hypothetical protein
VIRWRLHAGRDSALQFKMQTEKNVGKEDRATAKEMRALKNLRPSLHRFFSNMIFDKQEADKRSKLAALKILELIASGQVPQLPGEDEFQTACRLVVHGVGEIKTSASTRKKLKKALDTLMEPNRWTMKMADLVAMRDWRGNRAPIRAILLLVFLEKSIGYADLRSWLEKRNPNLAGKAPLDLMTGRKWVILGDFS